MTAAAVLAANGVHVRHRGVDRDVLRDLSLAVVPGEILALVGPNGSGKSTALAALGRALAPHTGRVTYGGDDVFRLSASHFARRVARLPQQPVAPEGLTATDLVRSGRHAHRGVLAALGATDRDAVRAAMRTMDVVELAHRRVDTLSGGERRRVWLAMALCQDAPVLLLDEPTAALDLRHQAEVLDVLRRLRDQRGVGLVVVLHELEHAARIADRVAVLHRGRLYAVGSPRDCVTDEMLRDVYGVDARVSWDDDGCVVRVRATMTPRRAL